MASPNTIFTELVTTTFRKHRKEVANNLSKHNALYNRIMKKGNMKTKEDGGVSIVVPLEYGANSTYQRFSGFDVLNVGASDILTSAEYPWRNICISVVSDGTQIRLNAGKSQIINLVKVKMKNAIHTFENNFSADLYGDGTLANQIDGLQKIISDTGTNIVGGIDASAWSFWANKVQSAAAPLQGGAAITPSATQGVMESLMLPLYFATARGNDKVDLIVADNNYYTFLENGQISIKRYTDSTQANAGFTSLKFHGADVIFDGNSGCPTNHMYFINSNYLSLVVHSSADLEVMEDRVPYNQDAVVVPIIWMGNLTCSNRSLQGVLKA